jgi:hypothetical protein
MKMSELFPSKYLKAEDFAEGARTLKIKGVKIEEMNDGKEKPAITFFDVDKILVLNKTNGNVLVSLFGDDTDSWCGKPIQVFATSTDFAGKMVDCIRLRPSAREDLKEAEFA